MTAEYAYDPAFPYVVVGTASGVAHARYRFRDDAVSFGRGFCEVIDTTPKPLIPEDALFITWLGFEYSDDPEPNRWYAECLDEGEWTRDDGRILSLESIVELAEPDTLQILDVRKEES